MNIETAYLKILRARSQAGQDFKNIEVSDGDKRKYLWRFLAIQKFLKEAYDGKSNDSLLRILFSDEISNHIIEAFKNIIILFRTEEYKSSINNYVGFMKLLTDEETEEGLIEAFFIAIQSRRNGHIPEVIKEFIPEMVSSLDEEPVINYYTIKGIRREYLNALIDNRDLLEISEKMKSAGDGDYDLFAFCLLGLLDPEIVEIDAKDSPKIVKVAYELIEKHLDDKHRGEQ